MQSPMIKTTNERVALEFAAVLYDMARNVQAANVYAAYMQPIVIKNKNSRPEMKTSKV